MSPTSECYPRAGASNNHGVLCTAELDMTDTISQSNIADFLTNAAWAIYSTYHTVLKTLPGEAIFGRDVLFDILLLADWSKIG